MRGLVIPELVAATTTVTVVAVVVPIVGPAPVGANVVAFLTGQAVEETAETAPALVWRAAVAIEEVEQVVEHRDTLLRGSGQQETPAASIGRARV